MKILSLPVNFVKTSIGSKRSLLLAVAVVSVMAILPAISVFVAKRSSAHGVNSSKKKQQGCCSDQPAVPRRMIGTYYTTEDGFQSTLVLNNKGPNQIMITPILHSQNGQAFTGSHVAVGGQSSSEVDLNLLASIAGPQFRSGSFEFTYEGRLLEMGGGLRIVNAEKSLIFDEQMLEPGMKFPSSRLEAVYAVPFEDSQVSVIVTNTTPQPIIVNGDAIFAGANGHHPIQGQFGPHETQVINLPHGLVKKASAGAVSLNHNGTKGALLAMIHVQDADRGYSESINFTNLGGKTTERHGAGLRLGSVNNDPLMAVIAVRNIGDSPTTVTATVPYSKQNGETGTISLPQVSLAPGEIKLLDTSNPQLRRNDFATAGLEIKYTGAPGSVIATGSSVSRSGNHVFALPMKDPQGGLSSTGGYPWFINGTASTIVFIKNTTDEPRPFHLDIVYEGGRWGSNSRTLAPHQTISFDVRKIRDTQEQGHGSGAIPLDATSGHIAWSFLGKQDKVFIGRAQMIDTASGVVSTYECQCSCGYSYSSSRFTPGITSGFIGDTTSHQVEEQDWLCFGTYSSWYNVPNPVAFSTQNPSVATISSAGTSLGSVSAVGVGTANLTGQFSAVQRIWNGFSCTSVPTMPACSASYEVQCRVPTGETIAAGGWVDSRHRWEQELTPTTTDWNGRLIREVNFDAPGDSCVFVGSIFDGNPGVTRLDPLTVAFNGYDDVVGWIPSAVTYYRAERPLRSLPMPCAYVTLQETQILCPPSDWRMFVQNVLVGRIGLTTVDSERSTLGRPVNKVSRTYP